MKRFIALLILMLFFSANASFAFSELYYLKNATVAQIQPTVMNGFYSQDFRVVKQNPYYATSTKNSGDYAVIILQQSGSNLFYYYQSNTNKKINKYVLKAIRRADIDYEQSVNANLLSIYDGLAQRAMSSNSTVNNYVFTDNEPEYSTTNVASTSSNTSQVSSNSLKGYVASINSGTKLNIYLQSAINTSNAVEGDRVIAVLSSDLKYNGVTVIPQGSMVYGILTKARHATYGSRNGRVVIDFNQIVTPDGKTYNIDTEKVDFTVTNEGKFASVASNAAVGAVVGALAGLLVGAISGHVGAGAAIGAGVGAGGALVTSTAERGVDAEIPSFTEMEIVLTKSFTATVSY